MRHSLSLISVSLLAVLSGCVPQGPSTQADQKIQTPFYQTGTTPITAIDTKPVPGGAGRPNEWDWKITFISRDPIPSAKYLVKAYGPREVGSGSKTRINVGGDTPRNLVMNTATGVDGNRLYVKTILVTFKATDSGVFQSDGVVDVWVYTDGDTNRPHPDFVISRAELMKF